MITHNGEGTQVSRRTRRRTSDQHHRGRARSRERSTLAGQWHTWSSGACAGDSGSRSGGGSDAASRCRRREPRIVSTVSAAARAAARRESAKPALRPELSGPFGVWVSLLIFPLCRPVHMCVCPIRFPKQTRRQLRATPRLLFGLPSGPIFRRVYGALDHSCVCPYQHRPNGRWRDPRGAFAHTAAVLHASTCPRNCRSRRCSAAPADAGQAAAERQTSLSHRLLGAASKLGKSLPTPRLTPRGDATPRERKRKQHTVEIERPSRQAPLDVTLVDVEGVGVVVSKMERHGTLAAAGGLRPGDVILTCGSVVVEYAVDAVRSATMDALPSALSMPCRVDLSLTPPPSVHAHGHVDMCCSAVLGAQARTRLS